MRRDEGRIEREPQELLLAFEMGHFLGSHPSDLWCPVFLKGGENGKRKEVFFTGSDNPIFFHL